jgi:hypothetical protein
MALTSSIGISKFWDHFSHSAASVALVLRRDFEAGADFGATSLFSALTTTFGVSGAGVSAALTSTF